MRNLLLFTVLATTIISAQAKKADHGLVEITDQNIVLEILYATPNNFTGHAVYESPRCFLRKKTAEKLYKVQKELETLGLRLKIWDAYRPRSVQYIFWELVPDPRYVADPSKGSRHNRGTSVDCTLIDKNGNELEMPSAFDDFSEKAHRNYETMSPEAAKNCKLLQDLMVKYGFTFFHSEWWHFDDTEWREYDLLDIPIAEL